MLTVLLIGTHQLPPPPLSLFGSTIRMTRRMLHSIQLEIRGFSPYPDASFFANWSVVKEGPLGA